MTKEKIRKNLHSTLNNRNKKTNNLGNSFYKYTIIYMQQKNTIIK